MPLTERNFKFYRDEIKDDIREHDSKLKWVNRPEEVKAAYQGRFHRGDMLDSNRNDEDPSLIEGQRQVIENYLFISCLKYSATLFIPAFTSCSAGRA